MRFTYSSGQRPLTGYTLKRGIGKGGFGEVYFAVSDGGKEVALKLVRGDDQVELRGVAQCLNLKHPNLVSLWDLKPDDRGDHWVLMEYIAGDPLNVVLARHPQGLPRELAREWFLGLARAVSYLHDHGLVHRDLKPANIFIENGMVKVGDYGLSKAMSTSQKTVNTQSVGTVHYMAPEISTGNYNKQIDTYAAGVILYEMVSGHVPFDGESAGEVLMKHLTSPPDVSKVPAEWRPIISKALSKNPAQRYASMADMARDVEKVGQENLPSGKAGAGAPMPALGKQEILEALPAITLREQVHELALSLVACVPCAGVASLLWYALGQVGYDAAGPRKCVSLFFLTVLASWIILIPAKFWTERRGDSLARRGVMMLLGALLGLFALWLEGWSPGSAEKLVEGGALVPLFPEAVVNVASFASYYALAFFALRWWRMTAKRRPHRFSFVPVLAAGFWGVVLMLLIQPHSWASAVALVLASAIAQLVSPNEPPPPPIRRARRAYS
jgi:hypothetical protein